MKRTQTVSFILCAAIMMLVGSFAWAKPVAYDSKKLKWEWAVNGDEDNKGTSTITMKEEQISKGVTGYSFSGNITNAYEYGFVNVKLYPDDATLDILKKCSGLSFKVIGDGEPYAVKIVTSDIQDYAYYEYRFDTVKGQPITVVVPNAYLMQPSWGKPVGAAVNTSNALFVEYQTTRNGSPGSFEFKLWDFKLYTGDAPALSAAEKKANEKAVKDAAAAEAKMAKTVGGSFGPMDLVLGDNFEYGDGYQGMFADKNLFNGHKIVPGEKYTLKITYTASRDLEDDIQVGLVDPSPAASYWRSLSWDDAKDVQMAQIPKSKAGETVSVTINLTTLASATSASAPANALVFQTRGEGKKGSKGSGKQKAVTLKFTEFIFSEDGKSVPEVSGGTGKAAASASTAKATSKEPIFGKPTPFQTELNSLMSKLPLNIAGKQINISFEGDSWRGKLNGQDLLAGDFIVNESPNGDAVITIKQSFLFADSGIKNPLTGKSLATWVSTPGPELVLEYKKGPPASIGLKK